MSGDASVSATVSETDGVKNESAAARVGAAFVFDIFGETARRQEAADAQLEAAELDVGTARLAYLSELISTYIRLRYFQAAQGVTRQTISSRETSLRITRERRAAGSATQLDVARASSLAASSRSSLPPLQAEERTAAFRIATLINQPSDAVLARIAHLSKIPSPAAHADVGLPADLLRNRPDIRAAERRLAAATAAIGIREAELYPSLRLNGSVSVAQSDAWSFGPSIVLPLADRPGLRANKVVAVAEAREAEVNYRAAYLAAIEEMQTAMMQTQMRQRQVTELVSATSSAQAATSLAIQSFEAGAVALDAVLDTEQTRLSSSLDLLFSQSELAQAWVRQQLAAGKGWAAAPASSSVAPSDQSADGS
ncbi:MAG: TolC family protein [Paracoccaceae bacterium]